MRPSLSVSLMARDDTLSSLKKPKFFSWKASCGLREVECCGLIGCGLAGGKCNPDHDRALLFLLYFFTTALCTTVEGLRAIMANMLLLPGPCTGLPVRQSPGAGISRLAPQVQDRARRLMLRILAGTRSSMPAIGVLVRSSQVQERLSSVRDAAGFKKQGHRSGTSYSGTSSVVSWPHSTRASRWLSTRRLRVGSNRLMQSLPCACFRVPDSLWLQVRPAWPLG